MNQAPGVQPMACVPSSIAVGQFGVPQGGSGLYLAHPVVCGGRQYVRRADCLFACDINARRTL